MVEEREYTRRSSMPLTELLPHLTAYTPYEMMPLPSGLKYLRVAPNEQTLKASIIVQVDPTTHAIRFINGSARSGEPERTYNIMLPYLFFYFRMNSNTLFTATGESIIWTPEYWGTFWGKAPLTSMDQIVLPAMMPNCYPTGEVCHGSVSVDASDKLGVWVDTAVNTFLTSQFNMDLHYEWPYPSMARWQTATTRDNMSWQDWEQWDSMGAPLQEKLDYVSRTDWPSLMNSSPDATPIPPIATRPSFDNVSNWLANISADSRARLLAGLQAMETDG